MVVKSLVFQQAKDENSPFRPQTTTHYNYNDFGRIRLKVVRIMDYVRPRAKAYA